MPCSARLLRALPCVLSIAATAAPACAQVVPDGFQVTHVLTGPFTGDPVAFTWLPDGRRLLVERNSGAVRVQPVDSISSTVVFTVPDVESFSPERGLLGVAVDPAWPARPYVYLYFTHVDSVAHLTMVAVDGDLTDPASTHLVFGVPYPLLTDIPDVYSNHNGGTLRFGPGGMLYLSLGDDGIGCNAQDATVLAGGILRLDVSAMPGPGPGPPPKADITPADNPFPGPDENARLFWAIGMRNPFRFTVDPAGGDLVVGDVGQSTWEEMDLVEWPAPGGNYGWPNLEGPEDPMCCGSGTCGSGPYVAPLYFYPHDTPGGKSVIGGPRVRTSKGPAPLLPASYEGSIFLVEFVDGWIRRLVETPGGWEVAPAVPGQPSPENWGEGFAQVSDLQQGPDGALYLLEIYGTARGLYRIAADTTMTGVAAEASPPVELEVAPNPLRAGSGTAFRWSSAVPGRVRVEIHDVTGRRLRVLTGSTAASGSGTIRWSGELPGATVAPPGLYFYRWRQGPEIRTGKLVVLP